MNDIENQIVETWRIHQRIMIYMLENIPEEALKATLSTRGGRDIARQLAHVHNVRVGHLKSFAKKMGTPLIEFEKDKSPAKAELMEAFRQTGEVMEKCIVNAVENGGKVSNFKRGVVPLLGYYISHEAHHRGHLYLTMKKSGFPLPDSLRWGVWDWNKM